MANATTNTTVSVPTIRPQEAEHFGRLAQQWWDPRGSSAMLHRLNPVRLAFVRDAVDAHWPHSAAQALPLAGRAALDVGCGAGLLAEPLARLGATVTGVDAAPENIAAARAHAEGAGLVIDYQCGDIALIDPGALINPGRFDLVTAMEVIEHVADKPAFLAALASALADDGLLILSTPNQSLASRLLMVEGAERLGLIPRGTHHWQDFITPQELAILMDDAGLAIGEPKGISWSPWRGLTLSDDLSLNYIITARKSASAGNR